MKRVPVSFWCGWECYNLNACHKRYVSSQRATELYLSVVLHYVCQDITRDKKICFIILLIIFQILHEWITNCTMPMCCTVSLHDFHFLMNSRAMNESFLYENKHFYSLDAARYNHFISNINFDLCIQEWYLELFVEVFQQYLPLLLTKDWPLTWWLEYWPEQTQGPSRDIPLYQKLESGHSCHPGEHEPRCS